MPAPRKSRAAAATQTTPKGLASKGPVANAATGGLDWALAQRELLGFPAQHLFGLPLAVRIGLQLPGFAHAIGLVSRHRDAPPGALAFDLDELRALAVAAQAERIWSADFKGYCLLKLHEPSFRVTETLALAGAQPSAEPAWSLDRVLRWLDLELLAIEVLAGADEAGQEYGDPTAISVTGHGDAAAAA